MPWGEQRRSQVLDVVDGKVLSVSPFQVESQSMIFVEEVYVASYDTAVVASDIKMELHHSGGALYAYSAYERGVLTRLS